jgi:hypothetical protein
MPPFYGVWLWLKANPAAQWALGIVAAWLAFKLWLGAKIRRERADAAEDVIETIEKDTDNAIKRVEDDRRTTADLNDAELRKLARESPNNRGRLRSTPRPRPRRLALRLLRQSSNLWHGLPRR